MKRALIFFFLLQFLLVNCSEDDATKKLSGYFKLSRLNFPTSGKVSSVLETEADFDLGALKASREFFFMLGNGGESAITNVTLTTNDPAYVVSPSQIANLGAANSTSTEIVPIISLGVIHGTQLNGIGYTNLLAQGAHTIILTIAGKTMVNGIETDIESEFEFVIDAKVLALKLTYGEGNDEVDFSDPDSYGSGLYAGNLANMLGYGIPSEYVTFQNTGNVEMKVISVSTQDENDVEELIIAPGESEDLLLIKENENITSYQLSVDGEGTITDYTKYLIGNDGKIYFQLYANFTE